MNSRALLAATLLVLLAACGSKTEAPAAAETPAAAAPAPATSEAAKPAAETTSATASAGETTAATTDTQSNLERATPLPAVGSLPATRWVPGTHYLVLSPAQPTNASPGKVEVVEAFWYGCPHCYAFDPFLESWRKTAPSYVEFTRMPRMGGYADRAHAKLYYTVVALGKIDQLHSKIFDEIQKRGNPLIGNDDAESLKMQQAFFKNNGINPDEYAKAYNSFTVRTKLAQAEDLTTRYRISGVPAVVINGKYNSDVVMTGSNANLISLINDLAAAEKRR